MGAPLVAQFTSPARFRLHCVHPGGNHYRVPNIGFRSWDSLQCSPSGFQTVVQLHRVHKSGPPRGPSESIPSMGFAQAEPIQVVPSRGSYLGFPSRIFHPGFHFQGIASKSSNPGGHSLWSLPGLSLQCVPSRGSFPRRRFHGILPRASLKNFP